MGCLKKIINAVIFLALAYAFIAFGGFTYVKDKYTEYTRPKREVLVEEERDFGDLSNISADYALSRSLNLFGYRKLNAIYLPKNQKITIIDLNHNDVLSEADFSNGKLEEKLEEFSGKIINSPIVPISNIKATKIGKIKSKGKMVSYAEFEADVKMVPIFKAKGTIALYETKNKETAIGKLKDKIQNKDGTTYKLVISCKFPNGYESKVTKDFISQIGF